MTKSATRVAADKVTFTQTEVTSAVALKAPIASPSFTGNVGVGVTPETDWTSSFDVIQYGQAGVLWANNNDNSARLGMNVKYDGAYKYINTNKAVNLTLDSVGQFLFDVAPSGTADAAISWNTAMSIDNAGIVTKPLQPAFGAGRGDGNVALNTVYVCDTVRFNIGSHYNSQNGRFTAPVAGRYQINVNLMCNDITQNNKHWNLQINGSEYQRVYSSNGSSLHHRWNWHGVISLQANDYVDIYSNIAVLYGGNALYSDFSGYLIG